MNTNESLQRDTSTGVKYEKQIEFLLEQDNRYSVKTQSNVGKKRNGGKHRCDIVLNGEELITLKYQRVTGTADEKIPFECMKLQHAINDYGYKSATVVLGGVAWKEKKKAWGHYWLGEEFRKEYLEKIAPDVRVISHETFVKEYISGEETT